MEGVIKGIFSLLVNSGPGNYAVGMLQKSQNVKNYNDLDINTLSQIVVLV